MRTPRRSLLTALIGSAALVTLLSFATGAAYAQNEVYIRSSTGEPWHVGGLPEAMNAAFGTGGWTSSFYQTVNVDELFSATNKFIYMEGGDGNDEYLKAFLSPTNKTKLDAWVANGGSLFLNAADWGNEPSPGFGVTFTKNQFSLTGTAVDPTHQLFTGAGLYANAGTSWTGNGFAHDTVSGSGLTNYINGQYGSVLAGKQYGNGHVLFGGMTSPVFHNPNPQAFNLRVNTLMYGANKANVALTPEGDGFLLFATASLPLIGIALRSRHKKGQQTATTAA